MAVGAQVLALDKHVAPLPAPLPGSPWRAGAHRAVGLSPLALVVHLRCSSSGSTLPQNLPNKLEHKEAVVNRNALAAAMEHIKMLNDLVPPQVREAHEMLRAIQYDRELLEAAQGPLAHRAIREAQRDWQQLVELDSAQLRAMRDMMAHLPDQVSAMPDFHDALQAARAYLDQGSAGFLRYARESLEGFLESVYASPPMLDPVRWLDEEIDTLLAGDRKYRKSKLAWILVMFVPRFRLALYEQERDGDFDGAMQVLWEDLLDDPEVRARLRDRLEKSGAREELRQLLSRHLDKLEAGELEYAIMGLYSHIEGFLAELAVERGLLPSTETILRPDGSTRDLKGVDEVISILHANGHIDDSQKKFLTFVLSNSYHAHRVRHGKLYGGYTQERATALVLVLILVLCLSWDMPPDRLLDADTDEDVETWINELVSEDSAPGELLAEDKDPEVEAWIDEILHDEPNSQNV